MYTQPYEAQKTDEQANGGGTFVDFTSYFDTIHPMTLQNNMKHDGTEANANMVMQNERSADVIGYIIEEILGARWSPEERPAD